jgi:hypothetical protein
MHKDARKFAPVMRSVKGSFMLEGEIEEAICRCYAKLLPDLAAAGFQLEAQQAVLLGRRLDLLLRAPNRRACIVELKRGTPTIPDVRDQVLDYAQCWRASFPGEPEPRLVVIGTSMPDQIRDELANFGIEGRTITKADVLAALKAREHRPDIIKGLTLQPNDTAKVRHLLSDFDPITVPASLLLRPPWTHEKVFLALVRRGLRHKDLWKKNIYVEIYDQRPICAVLYGPKVKAYIRAPLHLNPRHDNAWREDVFTRMQPAIRFVQSDSKGPGKESSNFDHYAVADWDALANALDV